MDNRDDVTRISRIPAAADKAPAPGAEQNENVSAPRRAVSDGNETVHGRTAHNLTHVGTGTSPRYHNGTNTAAEMASYRRRQRPSGEAQADNAPRTARPATAPQVFSAGQPDASRTKPAQMRTAGASAKQSAGKNARRRPMLPLAQLKNSNAPLWTKAVIGACIVALLGLGYVGISSAVSYNSYCARKGELENDKFYDGITLEGQSLAGLTLLEATAKCNEEFNALSAATNITVNAMGNSYTIDASSIQMSANLPTTLSLAYAEGRSGSFEDRCAHVDDLSATGKNFTLSRSWNDEKLRSRISEIANEIYVKSSDAEINFDFETCKFSFNDGVTGYRLDEEDLYKQITGLITGGGNTATIEAKVEEIAPEHSPSELADHFGRISAATTEITYKEARNTNIKLASSAFNGMTVEPGQTVSFNDTTGERTEKKGYKEAPAYAGGLSVSELGGGVCQVSTTLYNAVVKADLEIVARSPHTHVSNYVPIGLDAAVDWPSQDMKFKNNTDYPIYIVCDYAKDSLTFKIYGYQLENGVYIKLTSEQTGEITPDPGVIEKNDPSLPFGTRTPVAARTGYRAVSYKNYYDKDGNLIETVKLANSTYPAAQETIRVGTGT